MKRLGIGLLILSSLTACGEKEEEKSKSDTTITEGPGRLPVSALAKPSDLANLTRGEVISIIESSRYEFLATEAAVAEEEESEGTEGEVDCFSAAFSTLTVAVQGDSLTVNSSIDMAACLKAQFAQESEDITVDISKAELAIYFELSCVGGDLSSLDGQKLEELEEFPECENNRYMQNITTEMVGTLTGNGQTVGLKTNSVTAISTAANEPCLITKTGENYADDGCVDFYKNVGPEGGNESQYSKFTGKNLKWVDAAQNTWYTSGSTDVELNDWAGTVTFQGPTTNALYQLKYGTETINGTLTLPTGLYFKNPAQKAYTRMIPDLKKKL